MRVAPPVLCEYDRISIDKAMRLVGGEGFTFDIHQCSLTAYDSPHVPLVSLLPKGLAGRLCLIRPFQAMFSEPHKVLASSVLPLHKPYDCRQNPTVMTNLGPSDATSCPQHRRTLSDINGPLIFHFYPPLISSHQLASAESRDHIGLAPIHSNLNFRLCAGASAFISTKNPRYRRYRPQKQCEFIFGIPISTGLSPIAVCANSG